MSPVVLLALVAIAAPESEEGLEAEPGFSGGAPVTIGAEPFQAAFDRAQRYEQDGRTNRYRDESFAPAMYDRMFRIFRGCVGPRTGAAIPPFVLVVSFDATGKVDGVFAERESPQIRCMAQGLSGMVAPPPPVPDFAEEIIVEP